MNLLICVTVNLTSFGLDCSSLLTYTLCYPWMPHQCCYCSSQRTAIDIWDTPVTSGRREMFVLMKVSSCLTGSLINCFHFLITCFYDAYSYKSNVTIYSHYLVNSHLTWVPSVLLPAVFSVWRSWALPYVTEKRGCCRNPTTVFTYLLISFLLCAN